MTVLARTTPGVTVNLEVKAYNYGQTVVADANGLLRYSLPRTYPHDTQITFTVFYGQGNAQSYVKVVSVGNVTPYVLLKYNSTGSLVRLLTQRLTELGYMDGVVSRYSSSVREAVKLFQKINGLDMDGIAGQKTQTVLYSVGAIPYGQQGEYPTLVRGDRGLDAIYTLQRSKCRLGNVQGIQCRGVDTIVCAGLLNKSKIRPTKARLIGNKVICHSIWKHSACHRLVRRQRRDVLSWHSN
jgi:hypothetical protein